MPPFSSHSVSTSPYVDPNAFIDCLPSLKYPISPISERAVSFYPVIRVVEIPNTEEYSEDEAVATWYDDDELGLIQKNVLQETRRIQRRAPRSDDCVRGLEDRTSQGFMKARSNRVNALFTVLSEQHRQQQTDACSPSRIGAVCLMVTVHCREGALDVASLDAEEAELYQDEEDSVYVTQDVTEPFNCFFFSPSKWFSRLESPFADPIALPAIM
jgi:hypothetical protein